MAQAPGSSAVYLKSKAFPPEYEDVYRPRSQSSRQNVPAEKVLAGGADRRQRMLTSLQDELNSYSAIGLLRVEFNGSCCMGTATISRGNCLLTCAHNVVEYDGITKTFVYPTSAWFELRNNQIPSGSTLTKRYQVTKIAVYPPYFGDPTSTSGFDLALCWIDVPKGDYTYFHSLSDSIPVAGSYGVHSLQVYGFFRILTEIEYNLRTKYREIRKKSALIRAWQVWRRIAGVSEVRKNLRRIRKFCCLSTDKASADLEAMGVGNISLVGFPGEYKGEKWGMRVTVPRDKREEWSCKMDWDESKMKEILVYDFLDSSPGQSGSPIIAEESQILGVHTGGSASLKKNWGTYITPTKLRWIADTLGSSWDIGNDHNTLYLTAK